MKFNTLPDSMGVYGMFGGAFVPELLRPNIQELEEAYRLQKNNKRFNKNLSSLLKRLLAAQHLCISQKN